MTSELRAAKDSLVATARGAFHFLDDRVDSVEVEDRGDRSVIVYVEHQATFEVELDWLERAAFLLVGRTTGGSRPPGYYMSGSKRVRVHLIEALRKTGLLDPSMESRLKDVMRGSGEGAMSTQLQVLALELRNNLNPLLARIDVVFS